ncbi:MAG: PTS 2-O-a-mannosyl-D-glycerate transporter subunit IIABC [Oenococcus sp.]|uniref:PTS 2-O-a-mannosyl-D-glycerate transporter subunit IIABC n=1 Tax=Oenococcus TaxID=46254 RepID=UPI0021E8B467|nr:PTS 2-O-a-mannosyl-D-glycerate transporter subunit IIABC [Oenococcus kitaharae]MCV3296584.1 PTS 2-O-a-mannosyl-D-glycerate transporter subunit IIABC [Oenococcus kitaharae]
MDLTKATSPNLIFLDQDFSSKQDVFNFLTHKLYEAGKIDSEKKFLQALADREKESVTGLENGLAIPHGKSSTVKKAVFAVLRNRHSIQDYQSLDPSNQVQLIFLLAIPVSGADGVHLDILSSLSTRLADKDYRIQLMKATSSQQILNLLSDQPTAEPIITSDNNVNTVLLGITACAAGIAHTYMAAKALEQAAAKKGYKIYVEKQGAKGLEDRITTSQIREAKAIIYAHDVALKELDRFNGLPSIDVPVAEPIRNADKVLDQAIAKSKNYIPGNSDIPQVDTNVSKQSIGTEIKNSILTGISYIIPIIIAGGMLGVFAVVITQVFGLQSMLNNQTSWLFLLKTLGTNMLGTLMVPVLSAYMAYSIADKPALGPGFAGGLAANMIGSGFLGGMLAGFIAGYAVKWMKNHIKSNGSLSSLITFWVYPVLGSLVVGILMLLVIGKPVTWLNTSLISMLNHMSGSGAIILGIVLGIMTSFDLGGPVNKAAYAFCLGAIANGNFAPFAIFTSIKMVSAFSVTAACVLRKDLFNEEERQIGKQTWVLGLAGITEGAIPFAMLDPIRVIGSFIVGSMVTGAIVAYFKVKLSMLGAGIFSMFFLQGNVGLVGNIAIWLGSALLGALISTILLILTRSQKISKSLKTAPSSKKG